MLNATRWRKHCPDRNSKLARATGPDGNVLCTARTLQEKSARDMVCLLLTHVRNSCLTAFAPGIAWLCSSSSCTGYYGVAAVLTSTLDRLDKRAIRKPELNLSMHITDAVAT